MEGEAVKLILGAVLAAAAILPAMAADAPPMRIFIASDSTAQDYKPDRYPQTGWGTMLRCAVTGNVEIENRAIGGRSTNSFIREDRNGRALERVFWSWYKPNENSAVKWVAPEHQRWIFGNARALYKMYFSSQMPSPKQTADESACIEFAQRFLPQLENALLEQDVEPNDQAAASS